MLESKFAEDFASPFFPILADMYLLEGDLSRARKVCEVGLDHDSTNIDGKFVYAKVALAEEKFTAAEKWLKKVVAENPEISPPPPVKEVPTAIPPESVEEKPANLPNKLPLNANDFLLQNRIRATTNIVKLFEPYNITILTLRDTKLNISKSNDTTFTELINTVAPAGEIFQFDFESTINFEFWNNAHIKVKLNEIPLDTFFSDDRLSIRGSYEADKSQLYLGFYQN